MWVVAAAAQRVGVSETGRKTYGDYVTLSDEARALGTEARQRKAVERAADLAPIISEVRKSGVTSLSGIAAALTERDIPTARGGSFWSAVQVGRVLARLP